MRPQPNAPRPEVDVLLTVYNGERFISRTIESVLGQSLENWRLIVVNDQSTDDTARIVADHAARDKRIVVVVGPHQGIAAAANTGLAHVLAPFVARLDADDIAEPNRLATQLAFLLANPMVAAVGSDVQLIDQNDKPLRRRRMPGRALTIRETLKTRNCVIHPSSMIRTQVLDKIGGYREKFRNSEDYDLWLRIAAVGDIVNLPTCLTRYRRHATQITSQENSRRLTIYSVAAAVDYFLRYYGATEQCEIDEAQPAKLADALASLYTYGPSSGDLRAINRHAMRLLRHVTDLAPSARQRLIEVVKEHLNLVERLKFRIYKIHSNSGY